MSVRKCCRKARALAQCVESLDLQSLEFGDKAECRMLRITTLFNKVKKLRLFVQQPTPPQAHYLSTVFLLSLLERVQETLESFEFHGHASNDTLLPVQMLWGLGGCEKLSHLLLYGVHWQGMLEAQPIKAYPLKNLTSLRLLMGFAEGGELDHLLSLCPRLELFEVHGVWLYDVQKLSFSSVPNLKTLSLEIHPNSQAMVSLPERLGGSLVNACPLAGLTYLDLSSIGNMFTYPCCIRILTGARNLEFLRLRTHFGVANGEADEIAPLIASLQFLRVLELEEISLLDSVATTSSSHDPESMGCNIASMRSGGSLPELRELVVPTAVLVESFTTTCHSCGSQGDDLLAFLNSLKKLRSLVLKGPRWTSDKAELSMQDAMRAVIAVQKAIPKLEIRMEESVYWPRI